MSSIAVSTENRAKGETEETKREKSREIEREREREREKDRGTERWGIREHDERKSAAKVATDSIPGFPIPESPRVLQARLY